MAQEHNVRNRSGQFLKKKTKSTQHPVLVSTRGVLTKMDESAPFSSSRCPATPVAACHPRRKNFSSVNTMLCTSTPGRVSNVKILLTKGVISFISLHHCALCGWPLRRDHVPAMLLGDGLSPQAFSQVRFQASLRRECKTLRRT